MQRTTFVFDQVIGILSPYLGENMALASVNMYAKKTGKVATELSDKHLADLIFHVEPGLRVFLGKQTAMAISDEISRLKKLDGSLV